MKRRILITGAGSPGGPGIIKALDDDCFELFTCDSDAMATGRFLGKNFAQVPKADSENFIRFIFQYCIDKKIEIVLPLVTKELFFFSKSKKSFLDAGIKVIVSDYEELCIANNKALIYQYLHKYSIVVPEFSIADTVDDVIKASYKLGYPEIPVCVKPVISNGSRGLRILQQKIPEFELLFNYKPTNVYSTLEKFCAILDKKKFPQLIVSEYLPGPEYTIDALVLNGSPQIILPRLRQQMNNGITIKGKFEKNDEIIDYCASILNTLNLHGPIGLQVKESSAKKFMLLEINPRLQGTSVAALGIDINLPKLAVQQEFENIKVDASKIRWGTSFARYYDELFY